MNGLIESNSVRAPLKVLLLSLAVLLPAFGLAQQGPEQGLAQELMPPEAEQININQADAATIAEVLDGVGLVRAEAIVSWRQEYGDFASLEDLTQVSGVGAATVQRNEARIRFD